MNLERLRFRRRLTLLIVSGIIIASLTALGIFFWEYFKVETFLVEGNYHYSDEEIVGMLEDGPLSGNSLYLYFKYRKKEITDIPFIEKMVVKILSPEQVRIQVYEKSLAGFVQYLDQFMYFDKDGVVVECSNIKTRGVPQVTGLNFDHVVLYEPLPVERVDVFTQILDTTQLLSKYELAATKIHFDQEYRMSLYFDDVKVELGDGPNVDEKLMLLQNILPELAGKKGKLDLSEYTSDSHTVTFEPEDAA